MLCGLCLVFPMVLSSLTTLILFIRLFCFMVHKIGMGNAGAALAVSIYDWVEAPTLEAFRGIGSFMRLAWCPTEKNNTLVTAEGQRQSLDETRQLHDQRKFQPEVTFCATGIITLAHPACLLQFGN